LRSRAAFAPSYTARSIIQDNCRALYNKTVVLLKYFLWKLAHSQKIFYTWRPFLPDPDDDLVIELAAAAGCPYIVTHNVNDFKGSESLGIRTITPVQALNLI